MGPHSLREGCALTPDARWVAAPGLQRKLLLDADLILPQVPKVILVEESLAETEMQVRQPDLVRVIGKPHTTRLRDAVTLATDDELVQVIAFPAYGNLERVVEIGNGAVAAAEKPQPDERTDFSQPDMELVDFGRGVSLRSCPASVAGITAVGESYAGRSLPHFVMVSWFQ